jgi:hypothetical protein
MKRTLKHFPDTTLLALHLALRAARRGSRRIVISNDALKGYLGKDKVHEPRIQKLAESLKPIFPRYRISKEHYGQKNRLVLYLVDKDPPTSNPTPEVVRWLPNKATIDGEFPLEVLEFDDSRRGKG